MAASGGTPDPQSGYSVTDLVSLALRQLGIGAQGTTPGAADIADGVFHLNMMLAQWQRRRYLVPSLAEYTVVSTGMSSYAVGPDGDFPMNSRPAQIESAFVRYLGNGAQPVVAGDFSAMDFAAADFFVSFDGVDQPTLLYDYPLGLIESREDYNGIGIKNLSTWPRTAYYSPDVPNGTLYVWPLPAVGLWEIHIFCTAPLQSGLGPDDPLVVAPEYWDAIMWNLAARLAPSYGQPADQTVVTLARAALNTLRNANAQIPTLAMPSALGRPMGGGAYANTYWFATGGFC